MILTSLGVHPGGMKPPREATVVCGPKVTVVWDWWGSWSGGQSHGGQADTGESEVDSRLQMGLKRWQSCMTF